MKNRLVLWLLVLALVVGVLPAVLAEEALSPVLTAYSDVAPTLDGSLVGDGWQMAGAGGRLGARWRKDMLYLAIDGEFADLTVNGIAVEPEQIAVDAVTELSVTMEQLGLTKPPIGAQLPVTMTVDGTDWEGTLELSGLDWFAVENSATELKADARTLAASGQQLTEMQGNEKIEGGYRAYDLYLDGGTNPVNTRNMIGYGAENSPLYAELKKHEYPTHVELDLHVAALPVYDRAKSVQTGSKLYATYGISFVLADEYRDPANSNYWSNVIRAGIVRTADGLEFVSFLGSGKYVYTPLNKQVGDTFRLAMRWEMDGSLTLWVDGEQLAQIAGVETSLHWYADECFTVNTIRSGEAAASEADNIDISVTNLAMAKYIDPYTIPTVVAEGLCVTAYAADVTVDGALTESDWRLNNTVLDEDGAYAGRFGALWNEDGLYLAVEAAAETVTLELDKQPVTVNLTTGAVESELPVTATATDGIAELFLPIRALDVIEAEPGMVLPIIVRMGEAAFSGELVTMDMDWFLTDVTVMGKANTGVGNIQNSSRDKSGQGAVAITGGYQVYDRYVEGQSNYGSGRTYVYYSETSKGYFKELDDTTRGNYSEFVFHAESMPAWTDAQAQSFSASWSDHASRGLAWSVGNKDSANVITYISLGIYNTTDGLKLAVRKADNTVATVLLGKEVGEKFRIGTMCHVDGSLDVYINGERLTEKPIAAVRRSTGGIVDGFGMNLFRAEKTFTSSAEDIVINVTEIAFGKQLPAAEASAVTSPTVVEAAYTADAVMLDGIADEAGWLMHTHVGNTGKFGVQWTTEGLYLAVDTNGAALSLQLNEKTVDLTDAVTADGMTELFISFDELGVTVYDYGTRIPIAVTLGENTYTGTVKLIAADWVLAESDAHPLKVSGRGTIKRGNENPTALQGTELVDGGVRMYDFYDPAGENPAQIRSYFGYGLTSHTDWALLDDRTQDTWLSFDLRVDAMPVYTAANAVGPTKYNACYGLSVYMTDRYQERNIHNLVGFGVYNSAQGLVLTAQRNTGTPLTIPMNRQVGDTVRIGVVWRANGDLVLFVDGEEAAVVEKAEIRTSAVASCSTIFNLIRNQNAAASVDDDMDLTITNVAGGKLKVLSLMELLTWDTIRGENETQEKVQSDLLLPASLTDGILTGTLTWESDNEAAVTADGKVTIPDTLGELAILTGTMTGAGSRSFELIIPGTGTEAGNVLIVENDRNPAVGVGVPKVTHRFTLDESNNSVVLDLEEKQTVSVVKLRDGDTSARLREDVLTLWISDDNVTYTQVKDFKLLQQGEIWYLYDFSAEGRYVKVHCAHYDGKEADFIGSLAAMLEAEDNALLGTGFTESTASVTNETGKERYDYVFSVEGEAQRVLLDGELLYHYTENGKTYVRVPYLADGETVALTVLTGSADAVDLANKEYVYEVSHGLREAWIVTDTRWIQTLGDGTMVGIYTDKSYGYDRKAISFSYDEGRTWTENTILEVADGVINNGAAYIYDRHTGRLIVHGSVTYNYNINDVTQSDSRTSFIASDDNGKTWYYLGQLQTNHTYIGSYSPGVEVCTYDGHGPNVDFVIPMAAQYTSNDGTLCTVVAYSTDAGDTWQTGDSVITTPDNTGKSEGGASEATIMERDDGVLVLYTRYQSPTSQNFYKAYSYDHGITWEDGAVSTVYTTNTQPMFLEYNGADLLTWAGNNVMGGDTYIRTPMTVGVTYDGGENFRNLRDLYAGYSMQGLTFTTQNCAINQQAQKVGEDTLILCFWNQINNRSEENWILLRVDDFTEWFYRSKGAYDSFEHGVVKYEGWDATAGNVAVSDVQASEGKYSMQIIDGVSARSVPYIQNGKIEMQLYVSDGSHLSVNLQSAYTNVEDKCAPLGFCADNYAITFFGADAPSGLMLQNGWNTLIFEMGLPNGTAALTVNGETAEMPVNTAIGDYVCFVTVMAGSTVYLDEFCVIDDDDALIPEDTAEEPARFDIAGTTMTLGNDLALNFMVKNTDITGKGWYAEIVHGDRVTVIDQTDWADTGIYTRISYNGLAAKQMVDEVVITIYDANGNALAEKTDSIRAYAMRMFGKSTAAFDTVLADMLNYGAEAQLQFNYKTDYLANSLMTEEQQAKATATIELTDLRVTAEGYQGATLGLENNIVLNFFYSADYVGKTATVSYTDHYGVAHNYDVEVTASGSYGKVSVDKLVISDCSVAITVTIDGVSVVDSVESYCARMTSLALGEPLMKFASSARAFFDK